MGKDYGNFKISKMWTWIEGRKISKVICSPYVMGFTHGPTQSGHPCLLFWDDKKTRPKYQLKQEFSPFCTVMKKLALQLLAVSGATALMSVPDWKCRTSNFLLYCDEFVAVHKISLWWLLLVAENDLKRPVDFSSCSTRGQQLWHTSLFTPWHVES